MNKFIRKAEKAFYIVLVLLGAVFFLTAFLGSSMLNMIARLALGGVVSICGLLELVPDLFKRSLQKLLLVIRLILISSYEITSGVFRKNKTSLLGFIPPLKKGDEGGFWNKIISSKNLPLPLFTKEGKHKSKKEGIR